jgi:hypothetical protein
MKSYSRIIFCVLALMLAVGCASTEVTKRQTNLHAGEKIAKPERIYVYQFAATPEGIPSWSSAANRFSASKTPPTPEEIELGRDMGLLVAKKLVTEIQLMGLSALFGEKHTVPRTNDLMLAGYFGTIDEGSTAKRLTLGFGSGAAELTTSVEGYQMTKTGPRLLGMVKLDSGGGKTPGLIVPIAVLAATANPIGLVVMGTAKVAMEVSGRSKIEGTAKRTAEEIAAQLRIKFKEQGWIK